MDIDQRERTLFIEYDPAQLVDLGPLPFELTAQEGEIVSSDLIPTNGGEPVALSREFVGWLHHDIDSLSTKPPATHPRIALNSRHREFEYFRDDPEAGLSITFRNGQEQKLKLALQKRPTASVHCQMISVNRLQEPRGLAAFRFSNGTGRDASLYLEIAIDGVNGTTLDPSLIGGRPPEQGPLLSVTPDNRSPLTNAEPGTYCIIGPIEIPVNEDAKVETFVRDSTVGKSVNQLTYAVPQNGRALNATADLNLNRLAQNAIESTFQKRAPTIAEQPEQTSDQLPTPVAAIENNAMTGPYTDGLQPIVRKAQANGVYEVASTSAAPLTQETATSAQPGWIGRALNSVLADWRVGLLAITGLVLSIASGITTWDGMTNFTNNRALSLLITFGIQGVMLIAAFIIGKTLVDGLDGRDKPAQTGQSFIKSLIGLFILVAFFGAAWGGLKMLTTGKSFYAVAAPVLETGTVLFGMIGAVAAVALFLTAFRNVAAIRPYIAGLSVIAANLPLWAMFTICMAISVFFSYDSLFNQILPAEERVKTANIRMQEQVPDLVEEIRSETAARRNERQQSLFEREGWKQFEADLATLRSAARSREATLLERNRKELEERSQRQAQTRAAVQANQLQVAERQSRLASIKTERDALTADLTAARRQEAEAQARLNAVETEYRAAQSASEAEARGVDGTGKAGRGPAWRALKDAERKVKFRLDEARAAAERIAARTTLLEQRSKELFAQQSALLQEKLGFEEKRKVAEALSAQSAKAQSGQLEQRFSAAVGALDGLVDDFKREPTQARMNDLLAACKTIKSGLQTAAGSARCDLRRATRTANTLFALNRGTAALAQSCPQIADSTKLDASTLLSRAQGCLDASGLTGRPAQPFRDRIKGLKLSRDDQANNFVVTINAFSDGNRLAYLALGIAIAIDLLVFMSGLFSARVSKREETVEADTEKLDQTVWTKRVAALLLPHDDEATVDKNHAVLLDAISHRPADRAALAGWSAAIRSDENTPVVKRFIVAADSEHQTRRHFFKIWLHKDCLRALPDARKLAKQEERAAKEREEKITEQTDGSAEASNDNPTSSPKDNETRPRKRAPGGSASFTPSVGGKVH